MDRPEDLVESAVNLAQQWMHTCQVATSTPPGKRTNVDRISDRASAALSALVSDPAGMELAMRFVDDVARPPDVHTAAAALARLGKHADAAHFLSRMDRFLFRLGALSAPLAPTIVVPAARARLRHLVGHLVADAGPGLTAHLARTRMQGYTLNVNLLGEAVLGNTEAAARVERTIELIKRPDVDYVSIKVSNVAAQLVPWDVEGSSERVVEHVIPLYRAARDHGVFVNLDMEEYRDLALTTRVFTTVLGHEEFHRMSAGMALQAYLPDALGVLEELTQFAQQRIYAGGVPIKVRLVKGANLSMEQVDAALHGWPQAPYTTKAAVDANYIRLLDHALQPDRATAVRIGAASHNLYTVALAVLLSRSRGVSESLDVEMLQGMTPAESAAVRDEIQHDGGRVVLYTPVVRDEDFDVAISYLVRRLEENASPENFIYALFGKGDSAGSKEPAGSSDSTASSRELAHAIDLQEKAFRTSVEASTHTSAADITPRRTAPGVYDKHALADHTGHSTNIKHVSRCSPSEGTHTPERTLPTFRNTTDTDPSIPASRAWAAHVISPHAGYAPTITPLLATYQQIDAAVAAAQHAATAWANIPPSYRALVLRAAAGRLEAVRTDLVTAAVHEAGKTVAEADPEISEAIDFANYYALCAERLNSDSGSYPGAEFYPDGVTLVTPPWNFPVAIPIGGVLAALAAGSTVIAKPAPSTPRCYEIAIEAVHDALMESSPQIGLDSSIARDVVQYIRVPDGDLGRHLVTHRGVRRVILTGALETAQMFSSWRGDTQILAETSGKNAIVVTPSADLDMAVMDVVRSAFGHAGQKCSAASLLILVGPVGDSTTTTGSRFRRQLVDAVQSLCVGSATSASTVVGPLIEPAQGKLLRALTTLEPGESWLVSPRCVDGEAAESFLWTPGVRDSVQPGSFFHQTEVFGPVLGIMTAHTLDEALTLQNAVPFGLTGGLHSLDEQEIEYWLERVEVGNAYVNRHITGAIVQRQSFGGWKASSVGPGAKAGGPNYVGQLGMWRDSAQVPSRRENPSDWLSWAMQDDEHWWNREFAVEHDPTGLDAESNVFRYCPVPHLTIRVGDGALDVEVQRVLAAAHRAGVPVDVSWSAPYAVPLFGTPHNVMGSLTHQEFAQAVAQGNVTGRIRVIGASAGLASAASHRLATVTVLDSPVVASGRRELLNVLREQSISRTMHRYGYIRRS